MLKKPNNNLLSRLAVGVLLLLSALVAPWWATFLIAVIAVWVSPAEEILLIGILMDVLYGATVGEGAGTWRATAVAGLLYCAGSMGRVWIARHIRTR